jgi:hypothetical protein
MARKFDDRSRRAAIEQVISQKISVEEVAGRLSIHPNTLRGWMRKERNRSQLESGDSHESGSWIACFFLTTRVGDWTIRIDGAHGTDPSARRHVHIIKRRKKGEWSWNEDGTRHDKRRFPVSSDCIAAAKRHASEVLNVPIDSLQFICAESGGVRVSLMATRKGKTIVLLQTYVRVDQALVVFESAKGILFSSEEAG